MLACFPQPPLRQYLFDDLIVFDEGGDLLMKVPPTRLQMAPC